jgi:excisionase family DNA binding protein
MSSETLKNAIGLKDRRAWRIDEFCEAHRVSRSTVYKLISQNKLATVLIGGRRVIPDSESERLLSATTDGAR